MTRQPSPTPPDYFCDTPDNIREVRPFYWVLMLVLAVIYLWSLTSTPALRQPDRLIAFTGLMLAHAGLHWVSPHLTTRRRWLLPYLVVQVALASAITYVSGNQGIALGLFLGLAGEAVGIFENLRLSTVAVVGIMAVSALNFGLIWGWTALRWWLLISAPMAFFVMVYVVMFARQASARERAQVLLRELEIAHRRLAEYAAQVEDLTLANERQRMARELHDTLAQGLAGLILQLEAASSHLADGRAERAGAILQQAMGRARTTLAEARRAIADLREAADPADLSEAVREEVDRFTAATGIPCVLEMDAPPALPEQVREHALRAVTEGLTNVARHAQARQAQVRLKSANGTLEIEVRDDGVGFDPAATQNGHYGLLGLRERARLAGGSLEVQSAPGAGTAVRVSLPLIREK